MNLINRTPMTAGFGQVPNDILNNPHIPPIPKVILESLINRPPNWKVTIAWIQKTQGLTRYAARKAMQWLQKAGYLIYERLKTGHTIWRVFDTPQAQETVYSLDIPPHVEKPQGANQPVLTIQKETVIQKITTTPPPIEPPIESVVVSLDRAIDKPLPEIEIHERHAAKKILDKITPAQAALVLVTFTAAVKAKPISNKIGYLHSLVSAVINGTFTQPDSAQGAKQKTAADYADETKARLKSQDIKINNNDWFAEMKAKFPAKFPDKGL